VRLPSLMCAAALLAAPAPALALATPTKPVDLSRYAGRWYEIARVYNIPERDCLASTIDYGRDDKGNVSVVETCRTARGVKVYRPRLRILDPGTNTRLRLTFYFVVSKDYLVMDHADDYSWAILNEPSGRWFWVFARRPDLPEAQKLRIVARAKSFGYDAKRQIIYDQPQAR